MSSLAQSEIINPLILLSIIVFDVGADRRIGWFRLLEPLFLAGAIVPFFFDGSGLAGGGNLLLAAGAAAGVGAGLVALSQMRIHRSPTSDVGRSGKRCGPWLRAVLGRLPGRPSAVHLRRESVVPPAARHVAVRPRHLHGGVF